MRRNVTGKRAARANRPRAEYDQDERKLASTGTRQRKPLPKRNRQGGAGQDDSQGRMAGCREWDGSAIGSRLLLQEHPLEQLQMKHTPFINFKQIK